VTGKHLDGFMRYTELADAIDEVARKDEPASLTRRLSILRLVLDTSALIYIVERRVDIS
jgi:hypothetical protein